VWGKDVVTYFKVINTVFAWRQGRTPDGDWKQVLPSSTEVKNAYSYIPIPITCSWPGAYLSTVYWYFDKHMDSFTFTLSP